MLRLCCAKQEYRELSLSGRTRCTTICCAMLRRAVLNSAAMCSAKQEYKELSRSKENTGITLIPDEANIYAWRALLQVRFYSFSVFCVCIREAGACG